MANADLKSLVQEAEAAVAAVKDPELKRAAFEKVLERLLAAGDPAKTTKTTPRRAAPKKRARGGPKAYVEEMIDEGFFKKAQTIAHVKSALANRGHHIPLTSLSGPLRRLCTQKKLRRQKGVAGDKDTYGYTNW